MRLAIALLLLGCGRDCPSIDGGTVVTFPPRDFACAQGEETPCELSVPIDSVAARTVSACHDLDEATFAYVIDVISVPEPSDAIAVGFDLDGIDSGLGSIEPTATCEEFARDYVSITDRAVVGVDNALSGLIGLFEYNFDPAECPGGVEDGCLDARLLQDIRAGALLLVLELTGVDSFDNDPAVVATLYSVRTADGALLLDGPTDSPDARAVPDQSFEVIEARTESAPGSILDRRLRVLWPTLTLPQSGLGYPDDYTRVELRADVSADWLSGGVLGGAASVEIFVNEVAARDPRAAATLQALLENYADVSPSATDPLLCDDISAGYTLQGVRASLAR